MNRKLAAAIALAFLPGVALAQQATPPTARAEEDNTRFGGTAAVFLTLPSDARGAALGGAYAALSNDISAVFYNPAGLALMGSNQAMFSYTSYIADTRHIAGAIGWSLRGGEWGLALSVSNFGFSDQPVFTEDAQDGNGETYSVSSTAVGLTTSLQFSDRFSAGITGRLVTDQLARATATGFTVDFGTSYHAEVAGRPLRASFTILNYGTSFQHSGPVLNTQIEPIDESMNVEDTPGQFRTSAFEPPTQFRVGVAYDILARSSNRLSLLSEFYQPNDADAGAGVGAEWAANLSSGLSAALRGSFNFAGDNRDSDVSAGFSQSAFASDNDDEGMDGLALGAGLGWRSSSFNVGVDYAYRNLGLLPSVNQFSIKLGW
ncbi:MAG: PorV/PorQ family protein [Gemmatimonadota bacterium]